MQLCFVSMLETTGLNCYGLLCVFSSIQLYISLHVHVAHLGWKSMCWCLTVSIILRCVYGLPSPPPGTHYLSVAGQSTLSYWQWVQIKETFSSTTTGKGGVYREVHTGIDVLCVWQFAVMNFSKPHPFSPLPFPLFSFPLTFSSLVGRSLLLGNTPRR